MGTQRITLVETPLRTGSPCRRRDPLSALVKASA